MILRKPSHTIMSVTMGPEVLIEEAGRVCYKSEEKIQRGSYESFIKNILKRQHESVIEHAVMTVKFICDRGVTHEIVRHRLASYSQESTRYCNYEGGVTFIIPPWLPLEETEYDPFKILKGLDGITDNQTLWLKNMARSEIDYKYLLDGGWSPQQARSVLPNSTKTEIVTTANFREWRHVFKLRTSKAAHPQMVELMSPLLRYVAEKYPVFFADIAEANL